MIIGKMHDRILIFTLSVVLFFQSCERRERPDGSELTVSDTTQQKGQQVLRVEELQASTLVLPLDSIITSSSDGVSFTTYIYEYLDTIPERPIRRFKTVDHNGAVVMRSFDRNFDYYGGIPEGDFRLILVPSYMFTNEGVQISLLNSAGSTGYNEIVNLDDVFEKSLFESYKIEDGFLRVAFISLPPDNAKHGLLVEIKEAYIEKDSVEKLLSAMGQNTLYEIERKVLFENAFLLTYNTKSNPKIDSLFSQRIETEDESYGHIIKVSQYMYNFFKFHRLIN